MHVKVKYSMVFVRLMKERNRIGHRNEEWASTSCVEVQEWYVLGTAVLDSPLVNSGKVGQQQQTSQNSDS